MKKIFTLTAILLLVAMFATVFVGCDKKEEEQNITADTKFEDIVSDKITEEELINLIKEAYKGNGNYRAKSHWVQTYYTQEMERTALYEVNNTTIKQETTEVYTDYEREEIYTFTYYSYIFKEGNDYYELTSRDNEHWEKKGSYGGIYPGILENLLCEMIEFEGEDITYQLDVDFEWNETEKGYYVVGPDWEAVYKFKNNRLCAVYFDDRSPYDDGNGASIVFYDFGNVPEITLPEITE